jgi:hypothetical protein
MERRRCSSASPPVPIKLHEQRPVREDRSTEPPLPGTLDELMAAPVRYFRAEERFAEKERARRADALALSSGEKSGAQLKRENESFAFPKTRARINLKSARSLV